MRFLMRLMVALIIALASAGPPLYGQDPIPLPSVKPPQPDFSVRTDLVLVDFVATKGGEPVLDLRRDDVEVLQDGKKQKIKFFQLVDLDQPAAGVPEGKGSPFTRPEAAQFVILLDLGRLSPESRRLIVPAIHRTTSELVGPGDHAMLALMGRGQLRIPVPFTTDMQAIDSAAEQALTGQDIAARGEGPNDGFDNPRAAPGGFIQKASRGTVPGGFNTSLDPKDPDLPDGAAAALAHFEFVDAQGAEQRIVNDASSSLKLLSQHLMGMPGRKNVVFVSDGYRLEGKGDPGLAMGPANYNAPVQEAIRIANQAGAAFYTVDPRGVGQDDSFRALHTELARDTGGQAIFGTNDLGRGFERAYRDSRHYYQLAFAPKGEPVAGDSHRIRLKTKRKDVQLRHRKEYLVPDPEAERAAKIRDALNFPEIHQDFEFELAAEVGKGGVQVRTRVPIGQVTFREGSGRFSAEIVFFAEVFERSGRPMGDELALAKTYTLNFSQKQLDSIDVLTADHSLDLDLQPGEYRLTVAIQLPWSQQIASRSALLSVPPSP